jgi:RNA polymerase sigma-70 factor, ECF subfamily
MERLSPAERGAYVLREAFDYPYRQISHLLALTEANARQLVARARAHLATRGSTPVSAGDQRRFITAFVVAAETGDLARLEQLLATDIARHSDRGRVRDVERIPTIGRTHPARLPVAVAA